MEKGYEPGYLVPEGVDPRLDNRTGNDRPPRESDPAVPQQVDGPDLVHQEEHAKAVQKIREAKQGDYKGMYSPGDHSLGDEEARKGNDAGQADDRLETDPESKDSASTDATQGDVGAAGRAGNAGQTERATAEPGEKRSVSTSSSAGSDTNTGAKAKGK